MKIRTFDRAAVRDTGELEDFLRFATRNGKPVRVELIKKLCGLNWSNFFARLYGAALTRGPAWRRPPPSSPPKANC